MTIYANDNNVNLHVSILYVENQLILDRQLSQDNNNDNGQDVAY